MRHRIIGFSFALMLVGCSPEPERIDQRIRLPDSKTQVLIALRPFGGGPGSIERTFYLDDGKTRQRIGTITSLYPTAVHFDPVRRELQIASCKANVRQWSEVSTQPYGRSSPITITLKNETDCGYQPFPDR